MDRLHALIIGSTIYYAHSDAIGSVIALTDASQNIKRTYSFDVWGTQLGGTDYLPFNGYDRARWKGAMLLVPELNLYYMRSRWCEGGTGRFLSEDPVADLGENPFIYSNDDPTNLTDPSGLRSVYEHVAEVAEAYLRAHGSSLSASLLTADVLARLDGTGGLIVNAAGVGDWGLPNGFPREGDVIHLHWRMPFTGGDDLRAAFMRPDGTYKRGVAFTSGVVIGHAGSGDPEDWGQFRFLLGKGPVTDQTSGVEYSGDMFQVGRGRRYSVTVEAGLLEVTVTVIGGPYLPFNRPRP